MFKYLNGLYKQLYILSSLSHCGTVLSSIRRLSVASQPSRVSLVAVRNYCAFCSSHICQVAQFTLSVVWGVQSCLSTYKFSIRLLRCNSPRGLYLEARYNGFFAPSVKKYRVYTPIGGWKRGNIHRTEKNIHLYRYEFFFVKGVYSCDIVVIVSGEFSVCF